MKYSDSEEFKKLKYDFREGRVKKDDAVKFLKQKYNSLPDEVMNNGEYLRCLGILSEDVGYFYSEDERLTFMYNYNGELWKRLSREDMIALFDEYSRGFSDTYILNVINKPINPKNYRTQENKEIDNQIIGVIKDYKADVKKEKLKAEKKIKLLFIALAATSAISFGVSGYVVRKGVDALNVNTLFNSLVVGAGGFFFANKVGNDGAYELFYNNENEDDEVKRK